MPRIGGEGAIELCILSQRGVDIDLSRPVKGGKGTAALSAAQMSEPEVVVRELRHKVGCAVIDPREVADGLRLVAQLVEVFPEDKQVDPSRLLSLPHVLSQVVGGEVDPPGHRCGKACGMEEGVTGTALGGIPLEPPLCQCQCSLKVLLRESRLSHIGECLGAVGGIAVESRE